MNEVDGSRERRDLLIVGAGGAGCEAAWVARRQCLSSGGSMWRIVGFVDDNPVKTGMCVEEVPVLGTTREVIAQYSGRSMHFHCAVGNNTQRARVACAWAAAGFSEASLVDPSAVIAETAVVGAGSYVGPMCVVAPHARIGRHVLINSHVGVGHHAVVGDFAQLCPGVRVNGGCRVDRLAFLGSNAAVHPGLTIGEGASVGAGSFVIRSVKPRHTVLGVPARIVSRPAENGPDAQA